MPSKGIYTISERIADLDDPCMDKFSSWFPSACFSMRLNHPRYILMIRCRLLIPNGHRACILLSTVRYSERLSLVNGFIHLQ